MKRFATAAGIIALATGLLSSGAHAQTAPGPVAADQKVEPVPTAEEPGEKDIVVTATGTNISGIAPVGTEIVTLNRQAILNTGRVSLSDVVRDLPQVTNLGIYREGATQGGFNATQANAINLRGLGIGATLTLVDGHRIAPTGTVATITDANALPIAMVERVELIVDGNSAVYGSDAIGGVVNFVTRKNFEGVEAAGRYTSVKGYDEYGGSITAGHTWQSLGGLGAGNITISYDYNKRTNMLQSARARLSQNLTQFGGVDNRITGGAINGGVGPQGGSFATPGIPGNIIVPGGGRYTYYGIPQGNGIGLTFANLSTTPNLLDTADYTSYIGAMERHQGVVLFNQELTPWLSFSFEGLYTNRHTRSDQFQSNGPDVCVAATSPFYIAGIPGTAGQTCSTGPSPTDTRVPGITMQYNFQNALGSWTTDNPDENFTLISGLKADIGKWRGEASFTVAVDKTCGICRYDNNSSFGAFQHQVNLGNINPFSTVPLTAAQRASFVGTVLQNNRNVLNDVVVKFDGPLFALPGGTVRAAVGGEYTYSSLYLRSGGNISPGEQGDYPSATRDNEFVISNIARSSRKVSAGFAELFVPIVGDDNALPLVRSLAFDGALRYDHYSDFGGTVNPKIGMTWKVYSDLTLRGSWGTSFRAPTLTDGNPNVVSFKFLSAAATNVSSVACVRVSATSCLSNVLALTGAQPGLKPEKAESLSLGFDYRPSWLNGFVFSTTYYKIHYTDRLQAPPRLQFLTSDANFALYSQYAKAINTAGCIQGQPSTYDPVLRPYLAAVGLYTLYQPVAGRECQVQAVSDGRTTNIGTTNQEGLDFSTSYRLKTGIGSWNIGGLVTVVLKENAQLLPGAAIINRLNTIGFPVAVRGRGSIGWTKDGWLANLYMNYVGPYNNTTPLNATVSKRVSAWTTFDAGIGYTFGDNASVLKGTRFSVNAQNLFDRDPPLVLTNAFASFDPQQANILGRVVTIQLTKSF